MKRLLFAIVFIGSFSNSAKTQPSTPSNCRSKLFVVVEKNDGTRSEVKIARHEAFLTEGKSLFVSSLSPDIPSLSGNLVSRNLVPKGANYFGLFTCRFCEKANPQHAHNHLMKPGEDGAIRCNTCNNLRITKDSPDGKLQPNDREYYPFPLDRQGKPIKGFLDAAQFTTPEAARAVMWTCDFCRNTLLVNDFPYCPTCKERHGSREVTEATRAAAEALEKTAHDIKERSSPDGKDRILGRKAAEKVLAAKVKLTEITQKAAELLRESPQFVEDHIVLVAAVLGIPVLTYAAWYFYFDTQEYPGEVMSTDWARVITFERQDLQFESGWCDEMPSDATETSRVSKLVSMRTHQKRSFGFYLKRFLNSSFLLPLAFADIDNNNGTFTTEDEAPYSSPYSSPSNPSSPWSSPSSPFSDDTPAPKIPQYRDWCTYSVLRWVESRTTRSSEPNPQSENDLYWPSSTALFGERERSRQTYYNRSIRYSKENGETLTRGQGVNSLNELLRFPPDSKGIVSVNRMGVVMDFK